jgi:hypothetical protein
MKKFLLVIFLTLGLPILLLMAVYVWTDPFCNLRGFDINNVDATNREYLSTELFLRNKDNYSYDSFVFASSRGGGINTYTWKMYLPEGAQPYLFQAWSETLMGIQMKMQYIQENKIPMRHALVLIDIPGTFAKKQLPSESLSIKHYLFTGQPRWVYNGIQFYNFIQSPSLWVNSIEGTLKHEKCPFTSDTITNDYDVKNKGDYAILPAQDSLKYCSNMTRQTFFDKIANKSEQDIQMAQPIITDAFVSQLRDIKLIFDQNKTDYHILITPAYCYTSQYINSADLCILQEIFGYDRVHDYSAPNELNMDYNNFSDPAHFDLHTGYIMLQDIYGGGLVSQ